MVILYNPLLHACYLPCMYVISKFCKDGLIMVSWPKHVVELKIK